MGSIEFDRNGLIIVTVRHDDKAMLHWLTCVQWRTSSKHTHAHVHAQTHVYKHILNTVVAE